MLDHASHSTEALAWYIYPYSFIILNRSTLPLHPLPHAFEQHHISNDCNSPHFTTPRPAKIGVKTISGTCTLIPRRMCFYWII